MSVHHSNRNSIMRVAIAVATCFSLLISPTDAFASVKSSTASKQQFGPFHNNINSSSNKSTSSTSLSAASMALPTSAPVLLPTYTLFGLNIKKQTTAQKSKSTPLFSIPSIFNPSDSRPIILFDGKCNLCNAGVQLIMDNDRASSDPRGNLRVAALQSKVGQLLLSRLSSVDRAKVLGSTTNDEFKTIVVAGKQSTHFNSAACILIGRNLKGPLRYLALLASLIPSFIRDPVYKLLSRHRKRLFGESAECRLWDENYDMRFVDDGELTGVYRDPFADPNADVVEDSGGDGEDYNVDFSVGPNVNVGDSVKVISSKEKEPIVHTHVEGSGDGGVCSIGLVGKVVRVLEQRAYPRGNVVVKFDNVDCGGGDDDESSSSGLSFEAHFFPGQLRKE
uniref:DUF393 domain-containing protein n=1 Tax=Skeletonema marinoi TaxID=267567 RepID=A0A7S2PGA6_9STRA|mmetsp:Transcript_20750/g.35165  ORF Transcript_20750/g.35165 Transcript_20750/m.35165 type:complete len:392 (+) Transcript_20750:93-1268(+)